MHEFSLVQGLIKKADEIAAQYQAVKIKKIYLAVGPLSGAEPELIREAFNLLSRRGVCQGAKLDIRTPHVVLKCQSCGAKTASASFAFACSRCGNFIAGPEASAELMIERFELEVK